MTLPLLVSYSDANLNSIGQDAKAVLKELSGKHFCQFHYSEPQKGHDKVRIVVRGVEWNMVVEIGRDYVCFANPWFRKFSSIFRSICSMYNICDFWNAGDKSYIEKTRWRN